MTTIPNREELDHLVRAARWELVAAGVLPGVVSALWIHLRGGAMPLALALGATGIAVGAAFVLDDPAATTLASAPATVRRRTTVRSVLAAAVGVSAWGYLVAVAWTPLRFDQAALELAGLVVLVLGVAALGARVGGPSLAGISGAGTAAVVLLLDQLVLTGHNLVSGGGGHGSASWWLVAGLAALVFVGATRDPAARRRR